MEKHFNFQLFRASVHVVHKRAKIGGSDELQNAQYDTSLQRVHDYYKKNLERRREYGVEWDCGPASSAEMHFQVLYYDPAVVFAEVEGSQPTKRQKIRMCHWYTRSQMWFTAVRLYGAKCTTDIGKVFLDSPWKFRNYWKGHVIALHPQKRMILWITNFTR